MKTYTARVVEIIHEEIKITFEVEDDASDDDIEEAAQEEASECADKRSMIGVMDRHVHDLTLKETK